jgi:hypothetical protein
VKFALLNAEGYPELTERFKAIMESEFLEVSFDVLLYRQYSDVIDLAKNAQACSDALIFAGPIPYEYACNSIRQTVPWTFFSQTGSTLAAALFDALRRGWDTSRISFDSFDEVTLREVYGELGINPRRELKPYKGDLLSPDYTENIYRFQRDQIEKGTVDGCITNLLKVHKRLIADGKPSIMISYTNDTIRKAVFQVYQLCLWGSTSKQLFSIMYISIDLKEQSPYALLGEEQLMITKAQLAKELYRFANGIGGIVIDISDKIMMIAPGREREEGIVDFVNASLLGNSGSNGEYRIAIGFGSGGNLLEVNALASKALLMARKHDESNCYVATLKGLFIGPLTKNRAAQMGEGAGEPIEETLKSIAQKTGIRVSTLFQMFNYIQADPKRGYTSKELSEALDVSKRSMDRILLKMDTAGYLDIIGTRMLGGSGRPATIVRPRFGGISQTDD